MGPPFKQFPTWQETAKQMQNHRDSTIAAIEPAVPEVPKELPLNVTSLPKELLTKREIELTESTPEYLVNALAVGWITSTEVTKAFLRRAGLAQKLTNCITELLPSRALARAAELDEAFKANGNKPTGPLHGLPISVKEHVGMKGLDLNCGFVSWVGRVADHDALILRLLGNAGAVFYARTTEPQTLMHLETSSNIFGVTVNPFNRSLTSGGSSGGEGALLGMRGSCLGIGTDIGGSIRSPAANNGVYGFRPTSFRLPTEGLMATMLAQEQIIPVIGPLSTSLEGIKRFMKALIDQKPWIYQPSLLPIPWREEVDWLPKDEKSKTKLKVAVLKDDGVVRPHPPILRALSEMEKKLKGIEGVEVVEWKPYKHDLGWEIIASLYFCDGGAEEIEAIETSGEPWRPLSKFIVTENPYCKHFSIEEVWEWTAKREQYKEKYNELWNNTATGVDMKGAPTGAVDVVLCPVGPGAAPPLDSANYWGYTAQWNLLDYPALVFPVTAVSQELDKQDLGYKPRNDSDTFNHHLYIPENYKDAPVSLQLVGRRYDDEKVIQALEFIQKHIELPL